MPSETGYWNKEEAATQHDFSESLAKWISEYLPKEQSVIDFGAGPGTYIKYLQDAGFKNVLAIEGDASTITETDHKIQQDLTQHFILHSYHNSICLEVGEHLPEKYLKIFLDNLTNNTTDKLILSWAIPQQEGYHHISCRGNQWVVSEMAERGFKWLVKESLNARNYVEDRFGYFKNTLMIFQRNLDSLGIKHGTDKSSVHHDYLKTYEVYLDQFRNKNISLIELGVGGYQYPDRGGESLRMWYDYFSHAKLIGVDLYDKKNIANDRTEFWQGSQTDENLLKTIIEREKESEQRIVIDDASHNCGLTIKTFQIVFPLLQSGDIYIVEDVHTSYFDDEEYGGSKNLSVKNTSMHYFSQLTHQINNAHHDTKLYDIGFIHFYKETIIIKKR